MLARSNLALAVMLVLSSSAAIAQAPSKLDEIVVKGQLLQPQDAPFTSTILSHDEIREQAHADVEDLFRRVPGMAVRDLQLGSVANSIVIRGFGSGGHGGDLGAVVDGIPLNEAMSHADGYVDLNTVVPLEIESFTVLKGPVSALYGNFNRGGLINIQTRKHGDYAETDFNAGSHDTHDVQAAYGSALTDAQQLNMAVQLYQTDGYRPQSDTERLTASARWSLQASDDLTVAISARYLVGESDSASYLTRAQFDTDPYGIDARVQNDGAEKEFLTVRADMNYALSDDLKLLTFAYTTRQDFTRWFSRPINASAWRQREETYDRTVYGVGTSLNGISALANAPIRYIAGVESFRESTEFMFFDGLNERIRMSPAQSNRDTELNSVSAFVEVESELHRFAQLSIGVRADRFTGGCERLGAETGSDPCSRLSAADHVSPKVGLRSAVTDWLQFRASWSEGFALPNGFVKYSVGGQPLDETVFRQTEVGAKVTAGTHLSFDIAAYRLSSDGEVRTVSPGVYENYGATLRRGIEASATWQPTESISFHAVYGLSDTEVERNADARLLGLSVAGVPDQSGMLEANFAMWNGWGLNAAWRYTGDYDIDAFNTLSASSYDTVDLGVAYVSQGARSYRVYARVENLSDEVYATSISLIGGQEVLAPGSPRVWRAGIQYNF